jgi:serine/threonine-protein kinase
MLEGSFGRYTIKNELGRGGMATVYLAFDTLRHHDVALKVLPRTFMHDPAFRDRFEREARTIMQLEHDAIVPVYDFGEVESQPFIAMRLMRGGSLQERLQKGPLPLAEAEIITKRICSALDKAHSRRIIHRDLKPGNIMFDDEGVAYLADFGIARLVEGTATVTMIGTPQYMAPEQAHGLPLDGRTDVYQMGVVLFEMLTGRIPFSAPTPAAMMYQHAHTPPPSARDFQADLPQRIDDVLKIALAKDKDQRFQSAGALATAFASAVAGIVPVGHNDPTLIEPIFAVAATPSSPPPPPPPATAPPADNGRRRIPLWATILGLLALLIVVGSGVVLVMNNGEDGSSSNRAEMLPDDDETASAIAEGQRSEADPRDSAETETPPNADKPTEIATLQSTPDDGDEEGLVSTAVASTLTASAPTETPIPTDTPVPADTPTPRPTNTPAPTPTWTPLPANTPTPRPTNTPAPTPCGSSVGGTFSSQWQANQDVLGCATGGTYGSWMAFENFENGRMIWREDTDRIYAIYNNGRWSSYGDIWYESDPEFACGTQQSPPTPKRGFGKIWCTYGEVQSGLGNATTGESGENGTLQSFTNGTIVSIGGRTYVLLNNGSWR